MSDAVHAFKLAGKRVFSVILLMVMAAIPSVCSV